MEMMQAIGGMTFTTVLIEQPVGLRGLQAAPRLSSWSKDYLPVGYRRGDRFEEICVESPPQAG